MKTFLALGISFLTGISSIQAQWLDQPSPLFSTDASIGCVQVLDANNVWGVDYKNNLIVKTTNGGLTWTALPVNGLYFNTPIRSIAAIDGNTAWLTAVYDYNYKPAWDVSNSSIYKSSDGGATWQYQAPQAIHGSYAEYVAHANYFFDANNGVYLGDKYALIPGTSQHGWMAQVLTTSNGGVTWNDIPLANLPTGAQSIFSPWKYSPQATFSTGAQSIFARAFSVVNNTIWYIGKDAQIYKSINKGLNWTRSDAGFPSTGASKLTIAFIDANNGLAARDGVLKRTTDGGATWVTVNAVGSWNSYEITPIPGTASTYMSVGRDIGDAGSSVTYDGGNTWTSLETTQQHFDVQFINPTTGWSGSYGKMLKFNSSVLGTTEEIISRNSFLVYPNPSKGNFNITSASTDPFILEVYDLIGNKVYQQEGNAFGKNTIDLSGQKKGIYLLHILSKEQRIIEKIVLQ